MYKLVIPESDEQFDEQTMTFSNAFKGATITLEHSLVSISKWEAKYHKTFLSKKEKTLAETVEYIRCMTLTQNVNDDVYEHLTNQNLAEVNAYIADSMTASVVPSTDSGKHNGNPPTSETIYYWMFKLQIPKECEKWHLNRLLTLINVFNFYDSPKKKMSQKDIMNRNRALNRSRRKATGSRG